MKMLIGEPNLITNVITTDAKTKSQALPWKTPTSSRTTIRKWAKQNLRLCWSLIHCQRCYHDWMSIWGSNYLKNTPFLCSIMLSIHWFSLHATSVCFRSLAEVKRKQQISLKGWWATASQACKQQCKDKGGEWIVTSTEINHISTPVSLLNCHSSSIWF